MLGDFEHGIKPFLPIYFTLFFLIAAISFLMPVLAHHLPAPTELKEQDL